MSVNQCILLYCRAPIYLARNSSRIQLHTDNSQPEKKTCITMEEWIDVWGTIVGKAKRMDDFPMWLQYYPKVLFDIINRSGVCSSTFSCFLRAEMTHFLLFSPRHWSYHQKWAQVFLHCLHGRRQARGGQIGRNHQQRIWGADLGKLLISTFFLF